MLASLLAFCSINGGPFLQSTYSATLPNQVRIVSVEELYPRSVRRGTSVVNDQHVLAVTFKVRSSTDRAYEFDATGDTGVATSYGNSINNSIAAGQEIVIYFGIGSGFSTSGNALTITEWVPEHLPTAAYTNVYNSPVSLTHYNCDDASIDTRRGYGQPNREGQMPADPNAALRNIRFGSWTFSGGLFAGNMAAGSNDRSGAARIQLWPPSNVTSISSSATDPDLGGPNFYTLTLTDMDKPAGVSGPTLGAWVREASDTNAASTESTVSWATRWLSITTDDHGSGSGPGTYDQDWTMARFIRGSSDYGSGQGPFINWPLTLTSLSVFDGADAYDNLPYQLGISVGLVDEANSLGATVWRYFASREYAATQSTFPKNASRPRIWKVSATAGPTVN